MLVVSGQLVKMMASHINLKKLRIILLMSSIWQHKRAWKEHVL